MKKVLLIANWKMDQSPEQSIRVARDLVKKVKKEKIKRDRQIVICPSFTEIQAVAKILLSAKIGLGAQDVFWGEYGAYTGGITAAALQSYGCQYVIVGHSERRQYLHEDNQMVNQKVKSVLKHNMTPIVCIGETFEERQAGQKEAVILKQLTEGLAGVWVHEKQTLLIAYEPVWVIGSGQAVDPDEAERTHATIKRTLLEFLPAKIVSDNVGIIYGGSVNGMNVRSFLIKPTIDGVLVGSASLTIDKFWPIIDY